MVSIVKKITMWKIKQPSLLRQFNKHPFHVLQQSSLPFIAAFFVSSFLMGEVFWLHGSFNPNLVFLNKLQIHISFVGLFFTIICWAFTILKESAEGNHTFEVQRGLIWGFYLFLITEVMLFFSFFWTYFWLSVNPSIVIGNVWPPKGTQIKCPWGLPLFNTLILLLSGYTITLAHRKIVNPRFNFDYTVRNSFLKYLSLTIWLSLIFLLSQKWEYCYGLRYTWSTNVFWSCFFLLTGFHGLHVLVGTLLLMFNLTRVYFAKHFFFKATFFDFSSYNMTAQQHIGFEVALFYWHFVDIVWIILYFVVYIWGF